MRFARTESTGATQVGCQLGSILALGLVILSVMSVGRKLTSSVSRTNIRALPLVMLCCRWLSAKQEGKHWGILGKGMEAPGIQMYTHADAITTMTQQISSTQASGTIQMIRGAQTFTAHRYARLPSTSTPYLEVAVLVLGITHGMTARAVRMVAVNAPLHIKISV
jgi:hypothetical protein